MSLCYGIISIRKIYNYYRFIKGIKSSGSGSSSCCCCWLVFVVFSHFSSTTRSDCTRHDNFIVIRVEGLPALKLPPNHRRNTIVAEEPGGQEPSNNNLAIVVVGGEGGFKGFEEVEEAVVVGR